MTAHINSVALYVSNLEKVTQFYQQLLNLEVSSTNQDQVQLKHHEHVLLILKKSKYQQTQSLGLYHLAYLLEDQAALASFLFHVVSLKVPIEGLSDHGVSEAIYLRDPEGNGIEVYYDRPKNEWPYVNDTLQMGTFPMNTERIKKAYQQPFMSLQQHIKIGHIHLHVDDIQRHVSFYESLGMTLMQYYGDSAAFLSYDGYHHHIGINTWKPYQEPIIEKGLGLAQFEIHIHDHPLKAALLSTHKKAIIQDPSNHTIHIT